MNETHPRTFREIYLVIGELLVVTEDESKTIKIFSIATI